VITLLAFLATPVFNGVSRHFEHEPIATASKSSTESSTIPTRSPPLLPEKRRENLSDPDPSEFVKIWFFDHPTRPSASTS